MKLTNSAPVVGLGRPIAGEIRMFDWLRRVVGRSDGDEGRRFFEQVDALNAKAHGGNPVATETYVGRLKLRSGTLVLGDPQYLPGLEVSNVVADGLEIWASLWRYPSGAETVTALRLNLGEATTALTHRTVGEVGIDSAKLVVADKANFEEHWTETGKDRIGVISTAPDDTVLKLLTKRLKLKAVRVNPVRAEVVGAISLDLQKEIEDYLKSEPVFAEYPFFYFRVQTNNSFDRANYMRRTWDIMPIGNAPEPQMFVCSTGRGDGCYEVQGQFEGDVPRRLTITFIDD